MNLYAFRLADNSAPAHLRYRVMTGPGPHWLVNNPETVVVNQVLPGQSAWVGDKLGRTGWDHWPSSNHLEAENVVSVIDPEDDVNWAEMLGEPVRPGRESAGSLWPSALCNGDLLIPCIFCGSNPPSVFEPVDLGPTPSGYTFAL